MTDIEALQRAFQIGHGCKADHIETQTVVDTFQGKIAWAGEVEVFTLTGHAKASTAYGWKDGATGRFITVLGIPPVDSALAAVRAAITSQNRLDRNNKMC
jgi:hypothetical protein